MSNECYNVLIVDDDISIIMVFDAWFKKNRKDFIIDTSTFFSMDMLSKKAYDAIIIDYSLGPNVFATNIVQEIRKKDQEILILIMSGHFVINEGEVTSLNQKVMCECLDSGANRVIPKDVEDVGRILISHLEYRRETGLLA